MKAKFSSNIILKVNMLDIFIFSLLCFMKDASLQQICEAENQYPWSYHGRDNNPSHWGELYPNCNGTDQSPVAIIEKDTIDGLPTLEFVGFDKPVTKAMIRNLGWTVIIIPDDDVPRTIRWGYARYDLISIHFHFGPESDPGAEYVVNGVKYPMEIHFFTTYKIYKLYGVLATHVDVQDGDNSAFGPIIDALSDVTYFDDTSELQSDLDLSALLPDKDGEYYDYYGYFGSNSIPPCNPNYIWWIFKDIGKLGKNQLDSFMSLYSVEEEDASDECRMGPNYRPVQPLGDNRVLSGPWFFTGSTSPE